MSTLRLRALSFVLFCFQGALNPEAEAAVTDRFQQAKARLRGELQDQLQSRTEQLDEEHSALEYVRNKAEISALEAKVIHPLSIKSKLVLLAKNLLRYKNINYMVLSLR